MLNAFPTLLAYGLFAPLILRVTVGLLFLMAGFVKVFKNREDCRRVFEESGFPAPGVFSLVVGLVELVGGAALIGGFGTQIAAIALAVITLKFLWIKARNPHLLEQGLWFYILLLAILVSLVVSGAGFFAIDLPL